MSGYGVDMAYLARKVGQLKAVSDSVLAAATSRVDASSAQAQAVVAEPDGSHWYLLTLAAQQADRGPEQQRLGDLVGAAVALSP